MDDAMAVVKLGRQLRARHNLKIRQPLAAVFIAGPDPERVAGLKEMEDLIADELNVHAVHWESHAGRLADLRAKPNYRVLGPRLGKDLSAVTEIVRNFDADILTHLQQGGTVTVSTASGPMELRAEDLQFEWLPKPGMAVTGEAGWVVALDTRLTPELIAEGLAREFVNRVQNLRKDADLDVTDRIRIRYQADAEVDAALAAHRSYIMNETLAVEMTPAAALGESAARDELNGHPCAIAIERLIP
jgi:isoleucyl-tRNA synthetase